MLVEPSGFILCVKKVKQVNSSETLLSWLALSLAKKVKVVRSDSESEFTSNPMQVFYREHGILRQNSCVDTPQPNGPVERKHCHVLNAAHALLFEPNLPKKFWGESVLATIHLINRIPNKLLSGKTPYEILYNKAPAYDHLRVFSTLCFAKNHLSYKDKFTSRSQKCFFVGYPLGQKGWRPYDLETQKFFVSRDVIFQETIFLFRAQADHEGATTADLVPNFIATSCAH